MKYFIADLHFSDQRIIDYEKRPFDDAGAMNETVIRNWNEVVTESDEVYVAGDVGDESLISQLKGIKFLIKGNHDTKSNEAYRRCGFKEVYDYPIIIEGFWIVSHEPLYVSENMPYANIFGHVHNSPIYKDYSSHHYCVSVERIRYTPVAFDTIKSAVLDII
ncbi:MAG: phosphoesterase [Eubacteriales bacterium]|nr:phosphoesterase [Eubacteriales bacterium]